MLWTLQARAFRRLRLEESWQAGLAGISNLLVARLAQTLPNRHQPLAIHCAVHERLLTPIQHHGMVHAGTSHSGQGVSLRDGHGDGLREVSQALQNLWTRTGSSATGANVLEDQVEAPPGEQPHDALPHDQLDVGSLKVAADCDLIRGSGVDLGELALLEIGAIVHI